jgi:hypothetical protein
VNATQAKAILVAYRPGLDEPDEAVKTALELARHDAALSDWWRTHQAFQATLRQSFRQLPVPTHLAGRIIAGRPLTPKSAHWWRRPAWLAAAAVIVFLLGLAVFQPHVAQNTPADFAIFRSRMVRAVIRQYTMDIQTNNMTAVRSFLDSRRAPADYSLPPLLAQLPVSGAGVLKWQGEPVSMVCLDSAGQGTLFLFIVNAAAVPKAPPTAPEYAQVSKLMTASWTSGGKTYLLAGNGGKESLQRFL